MEPMPSVLDAARLIRTGQVSAAELVAGCIARLDATEPVLNAWCHVDRDGALAAAAAVDRRIAAGDDTLGPLAGVPFGVKDLEDCAGMPTSKGSRWFLGGPPATRDDLHVARFRAAGAIPLGKTTTPEFGAWGYTASPALGVTRNPWDPSRTPGGSSGGTAATVTAGVVPFGTASDGGGSIRGPAASCGLPGLKPGYGRVPTYGVTRGAQNAVNFAIATTVADTALLLDIAAGPDLADRTCLPPPPGRYLDAIDTLAVAGLRVAWSADLGFAVVDPDVVTVTRAAADALIAAAGLLEIDQAVRFEDYIGLYVHVEAADMFVDVPEGWADRLDELDPLVAGGWAKARHVTLPTFARVERRRRALEEQIARLFEGIDVLLTPTNPCPPFAAEGPMPTEIAGVATHAGMAAILTMLANLGNLPAMSVPAGLSRDGLPLGLMITVPRHREDLALRLARIVEELRPWPRLAPQWGARP
jgi:aspartyl-tRNA(Asn)/glutamyl-tRNA(Gln) amidotransferase subunit A